MKHCILTLFLAFAAYSHAQIDFYINGQQVDNSNQQQVVLGNSTSLIKTEFVFQNLTGSMVDWTLDLCILVDDPNIDFTDFEWYNSSDPLSGIHVTDLTSANNPCQVLPTSFGIALQNTDSANMDLHMSVLATGCETHRYYILDGGIVQDSIDVQYCSVLDVNELSPIQVTVSPNPVSSELVISSESEITSIQLNDIQGKVLLTRELEGAKKETINFQELPEGLYLLRVHGADGRSTIRRVRVVH